MSPQVSIIVPVFNEGDLVVPLMLRLLEAVQMPCEVLAVFDSIDDTTKPHLEKLAANDSRVVPTLNTGPPGPAHALRFGFECAKAPVVVVTMADGSDDPMQIEDLVRLVERGVVIAAASRYTHGGQQVGGPILKGWMSQMAGLTLCWFGRVGTHDATNSFKAYDREFVQSVGIESDAGFELGIEMVAKARRHRLPVAEISTIWLDRGDGQSNFQLSAWVRKYLHWYFYAFGRRLP
ncbi:MAG: glycosyltransferase family 2 protein [Acidimicrobiales bacterium]